MTHKMAEGVLKSIALLVTEPFHPRVSEVDSSML